MATHPAVMRILGLRPCTAAVAFTLALCSDAFGADLTWNRQSDSVALMSGDQIVWRFNYSTNESKPCFHPVALPGGPELTWYRPADHKWHCGFWFSWKYINGINYWEEDPKSATAAGRTEWKNVKIETRPDHSARIQMDVVYRPANSKDPVLTERRTVEVSAPAGDGQYHFDWDATFTAGTGPAVNVAHMANSPTDMYKGHVDVAAWSFNINFADHDRLFHHDGLFYRDGLLYHHDLVSL